MLTYDEQGNLKLMIKWAEPWQSPSQETSRTSVLVPELWGDNISRLFMKQCYFHLKNNSNYNIRCFEATSIKFGSHFMIVC
jgi:hypothetical protein